MSPDGWFNRYKKRASGSQTSAGFFTILHYHRLNVALSRARDRLIIVGNIEYEKMQAAVKLLAELGKGVESIRNEGTLSVDETFAELEDI
ncbi:MAG: hypothetical protein MJ136_07545 [Clostridia bacterium]|nr:hypothetical protein [Clostridia bacterium]